VVRSAGIDHGYRIADKKHHGRDVAVLLEQLPMRQGLEARRSGPLSSWLEDASAG